jgi:hypothetical protein
VLWVIQLVESLWNYKAGEKSGGPQLIPAVTHALEIGFSVRPDRPCLRPIALLGLHEQIARSLGMEVGKAQNDERK